MRSAYATTELAKLVLAAETANARLLARLDATPVGQCVVPMAMDEVLETGMMVSRLAAIVREYHRQLLPPRQLAPDGVAP